MSKKMLKRSLALGALMAFVITGSAMAADFAPEDVKKPTGKNAGAIFNQTITGYENVTLTNSLGNGLGIGVNTVDASVKVTINAVTGINGYGNNTVVAPTVEINASDDGIFVPHEGKGKVNIKGFDTLTINVNEGNGHAIVNNGLASNENPLVIKGNEGSTITLNGNAERPTIAAKTDSASTQISAGTINVNGNSDNKYRGVIYAANGSNLSVVADNLVVTNSGSSADNAAVRIEASTNGEDGTKVVLGGSNITINANGARGVNVANGTSVDANGLGSIELGDGNTKTININDASYGILVQYNGTSAAVKVQSGELNIINDNGSGVAGIWTMNGNLSDTESDDNANVVIGKSTDTIIKMTDADGKAMGDALVATSQGRIDIAGNLYAEAENVILTRGESKININAANDTNTVVQLKGNVSYSLSASDLHPVNSAVTINLANKDSYFEGSIIKNSVALENEEVKYKDTDKKIGYVDGVTLGISNGATWNLTGASIINNATFGSDSNLVLKGDGTQFTADGKYALNGVGIADELTVEQGAKLAIEGIKEKVTYNIANGFESVLDEKGEKIEDGEYWVIDNNLLTGEWSNTSGLQVTTKTKDAGQIADDMGVDSGTASALGSIIAAANSNTAPDTPEAQNVKDFANALANAPAAQAADAANAVIKMAEAGGNSATAASIVKNVTGVTNDRLSFNCGHSAPHKGGHGVGLFEEGSGADIWVEYVHGKDEVEDMPSTAGASSYEGQYNGFVMGLDFKKVNKFQSGIAFNYGEGDTNSVATTSRTHSDYDFWGIGYYGSIHNDDSNVIFDINYAKSDSDVTNRNLAAVYEASPETTTWTAGVKVEKLYQNNNVQIVPYTGLRYMSIDSDDYATKCGTFNYKMDRQDIWLLPVGVSIKQEVTNDNGWTVSPRVDLSYIWAFGDTDSNMEFATALNTKTNIGYDVMDDGSFLGLVGIEAHKGQWGYGIAYSYQKGDHSESKKWFVDVNYSF